jgi:hypothetical protein
MLAVFETVECFAIVLLIRKIIKEVQLGRMNFGPNMFIEQIFIGLLIWGFLEFVSTNFFNYDITGLETCSWYERRSFTDGPLGFKCVNKSEQTAFESLHKGGYKKL